MCIRDRSGSGDVTGSLTNTTSDPVTVTFTITPTGPATSLCVGNAITATVLVNPTPIAIATPSPQIICEGAASNVTLSSATGGTSFTWTAVSDPDVSGASGGSGNSIQQTLNNSGSVSYTHLRAHETVLDLVCRLLLEKKKQ